MRGQGFSTSKRHDFAARSRWWGARRLDLARRWFWAVVSCVAILFGPTSALGAKQVEPVIEKSAQQLQQGQIGEAITTLESAADEGLRHPELSFNRGLAYQRRAGTAQGRPGDLGQAAAAFAEVLAQRPEDAEAARGLEEVQLAVARRNSKGKSQEGAQVSAPLGLVERALLSMAPPVLFWLSVFGSLVLSLGLLLTMSSQENRRLSGTITSSVGALIFLSCAAFFFSRAWLFSGAQMAVVVAPQAPVLSAAGQREAGRAPLSESTLVYVETKERGLVRLVGVMEEDYLSLGQVRVVSHRPL